MSSAWAPNDTNAIKDDQKGELVQHIPNKSKQQRSRARSLCRSSCLHVLVSMSVVVSALKFRHRAGFACCFRKGSGSHVHFRPRPHSSTDRWARITTHRHLGPHNTAKSVPTMAPSPPHVCNRQGTGLFPQARTCRTAWAFISVATQRLGVPFCHAGSLQNPGSPNWR